MNVLISSPYSIHSLHGNTVSAMRIAGILSDAGHRSAVIQSGDKPSFLAAQSDVLNEPEVLIALHARKSHSTIKAMRERYPHAKIILYLTGTDLYEDMVAGCPLCEESMQLADEIVVSQHASYASIPDVYQKKAAVIYSSLSIIDLGEVAIEPDLFTIASHLRAVKQPFLVVEALKLLDKPLRVKLLGSEIDKSAGQRARKLAQLELRFEWLGELDHALALHWMQRSLATINTSLAEGGANSVGESIVLGRPVLASKVEGNVGMLGAAYEGYFGASSATELAALMRRLVGDADYRKHLEGQVRARARKFSRENETKGWLEVL